MSDTQSIQLSWQWSTAFPLVVMVLLLIAALWPLSRSLRHGLVAAAAAIAAIFTFTVGPLAWATLAKSLADQWFVTLIGLVVIYAIGYIPARRG